MSYHYGHSHPSESRYSSSSHQYPEFRSNNPYRLKWQQDRSHQYAPALQSGGMEHSDDRHYQQAQQQSQGPPPPYDDHAPHRDYSQHQDESRYRPTQRSYPTHTSSSNQDTLSRSTIPFPGQSGSYYSSRPANRSEHQSSGKTFSDDCYHDHASSHYESNGKISSDDRHHQHATAFFRAAAASKIKAATQSFQPQPYSPLSLESQSISRNLPQADELTFTHPSIPSDKTWTIPQTVPQQEPEWEEWNVDDLSRAGVVLAGVAGAAALGYGTYRTFSALNSTSLLALPFFPLKVAASGVSKTVSTLVPAAYHGTKLLTSLGWKGAYLGTRMGYNAVKTGMSVGEGVYGWWQGG